MSVLPPFALGGAGLGNLYRAVSDEAAIEAVHAGLKAGAGLIDTAPYYGHGRSETRVGEALRAWRGARPMLSSKVGRVLDPVAPDQVGDFGFADPLPFNPRFDYSRDGVRRSVEGSFLRLGVNKLDIAFVHDIGARVHGAGSAAVLRQTLDETLPELARAKEEGLVDRIGIGVNEWEVCVEILKHADLDCILLAGRYTVLEQPALASGLFDLCVQKRVQVLAAGVFNSGLLASAPSASSTYNYQTASREIVSRAQALWDACAAFNATPQAVALQFPTAHPAVATIVVGAQTAAEVQQIARWRVESIPDELWLSLKRGGFILPDAPTPISNGA